MPDFSPIVGSYFLVAIVAAGLLLLVALIRPVRADLSRGKLVTLAILRSLAILLLVWVLVRPHHLETTFEIVPEKLVLLFDSSRSMLERDELNGLSRYERMQQCVKATQKSLDKLGKKVEVEAYLFDQTTRVLPIKNGEIVLPAKPTGNQTALGQALTDVQKEDQGKRTLAVLIHTEGGQNALPPADKDPYAAANSLGRRGIPVFPIMFGTTSVESQAKDIALVGHITTSRMPVFVKNRVSVKALVRAQGYAGKTIPVRLYYTEKGKKEQLLEEKPLEVLSSSNTEVVQFSFIAKTPGQHKIRVEAVLQEGEKLQTNNSQEVPIEVVDGGVNVLYIEGVARHESRFLRETLGNAPEIRLHYIRKTKPTPGGAKAAENPNHPFQRGKYDAYIIGDIDASLFAKEELELLVKTVEADEAGLILLGGMKAFGPGGYSGDNPLTAILPVVTQSRQSTLLGNTDNDFHYTTPLQLTPTNSGLRNQFPALQINPHEQGAKEFDPNRVRNEWSKMPPLAGANKFQSVKISAQVIAQSQGTPPVPLLIEQIVGEGGHVVVFAADTTWRWVLRGFGKQHHLFWKNLVLSTVGKDIGSDDAKTSIRLTVTPNNVDQGESVQIFADMVGASATDEITLQATVTTPEKKKQVINAVTTSNFLEGVVRATMQPGDYSILVTANDESGERARSEKSFIVRKVDRERDNPNADHELLRSIAQPVRGDEKPRFDSAIKPEQVPQLIEYLSTLAQSKKIKHSKEFQYWDKLWVIVLMVLLLSTEWFLRKHWGLV